MIHELLQQRVTERFGLLPGTSWQSQLDDALGAMTRRYGVDEEELARRAAEDPVLLRELAGYLTVDESYFLRHGEQYVPFAEALDAQLGRGGPVMIWSLGCSHGEEPYTVAILVREQLGAAASRVRILGTDINPRVLAIARQAVYRDWALRGVPPSFIDRHFERERDGSYRLEKRYRDAVELELAALPERLLTVPPQSVDFVLFRNVAIYFEASALRAVYGRLAEILTPGGMLLTAPADPAPPRELFASRPGEWSGVYEQRRPEHVGREEALVAGVTASFTPAAVSTAPARPRQAGRRVAPAKVGGALAPRSNGGDARSHSRGAAAPEKSAHNDVPAHDLLSRKVRDASLLIEQTPAAAHGYSTRGRLYLSVQRADDAVSDFRSALYLAPGDLVTRFWYATALQRAGKAKQARTQALHLTEELEQLAADELLSDGSTRAANLLQAVAFMRASLA